MCNPDTYLWLTIISGLKRQLHVHLPYSIDIRIGRRPHYCHRVQHQLSTRPPGPMFGFGKSKPKTTSVGKTLGGTFDVVFTDSKLGLSIGKAEGTGQAVVIKVTGAAAKCGRIQPGDYIVGVEACPVTSYDEVMSIVPVAGRPLKLVFSRPSGGNAALLSAACSASRSAVAAAAAAAAVAVSSATPSATHAERASRRCGGAIKHKRPGARRAGRPSALRPTKQQHMRMRWKRRAMRHR